MSDDSSPDKIADDLAIENEVEKSQPKDSTSQSLQKPARFQSGAQLNFNFIAYEEKIVIVGAGLFLLVQIISIITLGNVYGLNGAAVSLIISSIVYASYFVIIDRFYYKSRLVT